MNVLRAATTVTKSVATLLAPSPAPAILDTPSLLMEGHAMVSSTLQIITHCFSCSAYIQLILVTLTMEAVNKYVGVSLAHHQLPVLAE